MRIFAILLRKRSFELICNNTDYTREHLMAATAITDIQAGGAVDKI